MKILHISNFYYHRGGDCTYLFALIDLMEKKGHGNMVFSMHHPDNYESAYSKYFVSYIDYAKEVKKKRISNTVKVISRALYSNEARRNMNALLNSELPDIAHIQSMHHHLTHSILYPLKDRDIPVVWTLHDYTLICPNTHFLDGGKVCERCRKKKYYHAVLSRCKKGSLGASALAALETTLHRIVNIDRMIDMYITPSRFLKNKLVDYGFNEDKIVTIPNLVGLENTRQEGKPGNYFLYVGRLDDIKGVKTLIDAVIEAPELQLKIVGDGPLGEQLRSYVGELHADDRIEFLGYMNRSDLLNYIAGCFAVILPSEWYENYPYAILEAFACCRPVIGSNIGGIPELVRDHETGLLFEPGNSVDLREKMLFCLANPDKASGWGQNGNAFINSELVPEKHYERIMAVYEKALSLRKAKRNTN